MAETVIICSAASSMTSISLNVFTAMQLKGMGQDVALFFDWEALVALADKKFQLSPILAPHQAEMMKNMQAAGFPTDPLEFLKGAKAAGVPIYTCAGTVGFLGIADKVPAEIQPLEIPDVMKLLAEAKKVIGGF